MNFKTAKWVLYWCKTWWVILWCLICTDKSQGFFNKDIDGIHRIVLNLLEIILKWIFGTINNTKDIIVTNFHIKNELEVYLKENLFYLKSFFWIRRAILTHVFGIAKWLEFTQLFWSVKLAILKLIWLYWQSQFFCYSLKGGTESFPFPLLSVLSK